MVFEHVSMADTKGRNETTMKIGFLPGAMWALFCPTFRKNTGMLGVENEQVLMAGAHKRYRQILKDVPEFGENDVLLVNLLSASMLAAIYLELDHKPDINTLADYYEQAMNTNPVMKLFLRRANNYTQKYQIRLQAQAEKSQKSTNPYTWKFTYHPGPTLDSFDAIFSQCGIWNLMQALGIPELTPAICRYDFGMTRLTNTVFSRQQTLAGGGTVCDCHYKKRESAGLKPIQ